MKYSASLTYTLGNLGIFCLLPGTFCLKTLLCLALSLQLKKNLKQTLLEINCEEVRQPAFPPFI